MKAFQVGKLGEIYAIHFLRSLGYRIVATNFRIRGGEIDVIAEERKNLIFVEVKTRTSNWYGEGEEAFTWRKQMSLKRAIGEFLIRNFVKKGKFVPAVRRDVIELQLTPSGAARELIHFENV